MLVCICKGLSESSIRRVVAGGASSVEEVGRACGAGTDCGTCQGSIAELISEAQAGSQLISEARLTESGRHSMLFMRTSCPAQREAANEGQRPGP